MNRKQWLEAYSIARSVRRCEEALFGGKLSSLGMESNVHADRAAARYADGRVLTSDALRFRAGLLGGLSRISGRAVRT